MNPAVAQAIGAVGGTLLNKLFPDKSQQQMQEKFAKNAIQWKVQDALKAGIHPLYAMGANTMSYSPTSVGDNGSFAAMGADLGRAVAAGDTQSGRAIDGTIGKLALERAGLENDLLRAQIASTRVRTMAPQVGPAMPPVNPNTPIGFLPLPPEGMLAAQDAENWFGEAGGELVGMLNLDKSLTSTAWKPGSPLIYVKRKPGSPAAFVGRGAYRR